MPSKSVLQSIQESVSSTSVLQKCQTRVSYKTCQETVSSESILQKCQEGVSSKSVLQKCHVRVSRKSVPQKCQISVSSQDHLGVEVALSGHATLLERAGLLSASCRIQGGHPFPCSSEYQGLIIDDFFALAVEPRKANKKPSEATRAFDAAVQEYNKHGILGSLGCRVYAPESCWS